MHTWIEGHTVYTHTHTSSCTHNLSPCHSGQDYGLDPGPRQLYKDALPCRILALYALILFALPHCVVALAGWELSVPSWFLLHGCCDQRCVRCLPISSWPSSSHPSDLCVQQLSFPLKSWGECWCSQLPH